MPQDFEYRYNQRLQKYWDKLRGERPFPSESEINPDDLKDIWGSCFLISIDDVTRRLGYRYSYLGEELIEAFGDDANDPEVAMRLLSTGDTPKKFDEVIKTQKPVLDESEFMNLKHLHIRYRACLLPLGYKDGEVSHILGCMRWKIY